MFNQLKKKLTLFYVICFFVFFLGFSAILYFSLIQLMEYQQLEELETYYNEQQHDFFEYLYDQEKIIDYTPNRLYFYYIYTKEHSFVHADESVKGLYLEIEDKIQSEDISQRLVKKIRWEDEHFLLLSMPIQDSENTFNGYIVLGKSITSQYHFFQKMIWLFLILLIVFTVLLGIISYLMAGKTMVPIQESYEKQKKFVSDASHELRTPLSVFYSSIDLLEEDEWENLSSFGKELVTDIKEEAELMKTLIDKLLFLARFDQNRLEINKENIQLSEMLENIMDKFKRTVPESLTFQSEIEKNVQFFGDKKSIHELIYILLENAAQYTQQGAITIRLVATNKVIQVFIEDTGIGISKDDLPLVFDRFYRGDLARKRDGTGLGLSIAKAIVEEHDGTIQVNSELGKGTSFCIEFPFSQK